jgi:glutathione synthase/RimK-type ligase-like ATP-grasp enzyme
MILLIADQFDIHSDLLEKKAKDRGAKVFRFNVDFDSLLRTKVTFWESGFEIKIGDSAVSSREIERVVLRRSFVELSYELKDALTTGHKIWRGEWNKALQGMYYALRDVPSMNPPKHGFAAENKYMQMDQARRVGLVTPPSIVSNDCATLTDFQANFGDVVLKMMYQELYREPDGKIRGIFVNKLTDELKNFQDSGESPIFLQKYAEKAYEVRYTVVGKRHFACKIDSQKSSRASVDWRRYDLPHTPHEEIKPPDDVCEKVDNLLSSLGLVFGALDFVVTGDGTWVFLEVNPMGQWLWIEDLTGLPISDAIVSWMLGRD